MTDMALYQCIIIFLLIEVSLSHAFPQKDKYDTYEEFDSEEYGQFLGPKSTNCSCGWTNKEKGRIVGGIETYVNEFPHMAGVVRVVEGGIELFCGCSIITQYHALTAAHCTVDENGPLAIVTGEHDTEDRYETRYRKMYNIKKTIEHPDYNTDNLAYDIALLVIKKRIVFNTAVGPICLPTRPMNDFLVNKYIKVTGWGDLSFEGYAATKLQKVNLKVIRLKECASKFGPNSIRIKNPFQFCTFSHGKDSCQGDSGGPVIWLDPETNRYTLVGVVSYGVGCASDTPGVNTDVSACLPWIQKSIHRTSPSPVKTCAKRGR